MVRRQLNDDLLQVCAVTVCLRIAEQARSFDSFQCPMASADAGGLLCPCQLKRFRKRVRHLLEAGWKLVELRFSTLVTVGFLYSALTARMCMGMVS